MDVSRMHDMIEKLSECAKAEFDKGMEHIDADEMGKVTDMLKATHKRHKSDIKFRYSIFRC